MDQRASVTVEVAGTSWHKTEPAGAPAPQRYGPATLLTFLLTFICVAAPIGYLFVGSFRTDAPGAPTNSFTFDNWIAVYTGERYHAAFLNTVMLCTAVAALSVLIAVGMGVAAGLYRRAPLIALGLVWFTAILQVLGGLDIAFVQLAAVFA